MKVCEARGWDLRMHLLTSFSQKANGVPLASLLYRGTQKLRNLPKIPGREGQTQDLNPGLLTESVVLNTVLG